MPCHAVMASFAHGVLVLALVLVLNRINHSASFPEIGNSNDHEDEDEDEEEGKVLPLPLPPACFISISAGPQQHLRLIKLYIVSSYNSPHRGTWRSISTSTTQRSLVHAPARSVLDDAP